MLNYNKLETEKFLNRVTEQKKLGKKLNRIFFDIARERHKSSSSVKNYYYKLLKLKNKDNVEIDGNNLKKIKDEINNLADRLKGDTYLQNQKLKKQIDYLKKENSILKEQLKLNSKVNLKLVSIDSLPQKDR